jgi:hypothetical protein
MQQKGVSAMRLLVLALALLAGLKLWAQDTVYRSATEEALVAAYRDRAVTACQKEPARDARTSAVNWSNASAIKLVIGDSNLSVYVWEVDHELWNARYRNPYLVLTPSDRASLVCTYDIGLGTAHVSRA